MPHSSEGYLWTPDHFQEGLETEAVVSSSEPIDEEYDVIVVGAGLTGLVTARNLSTNGLRVLLIEGRDRIGGRVWTAKALGEEFEMGGTWIHWNQPHIYSELHHYGLHKNLKTSMGAADRKTTYWKSHDSEKGAVVAVPDANPGALEELIRDFMEVDGHNLQSLMPWPHEPMKERRWQEYDHLSIRDRLDQLNSTSAQAREVFMAIAGTFNLARTDQGAYTEALHWYSLAGGAISNLAELTLRFKIGRGGMSSLARSIYSDFSGDTLLKSRVKTISQLTADKVRISLDDTKTFLHSKVVVCTVPLNCLGDIAFSPSLSQSRLEAVGTGHSNRGRKFHFKLEEVEPGWFAMCANRQHGLSAPPFAYAVSDHNGTKESGPDGTYCAAFAFEGQLTDAKDASAIISAFKNNIRPDAHVQAYLTHDWANDPFAKGAWCFLRPGFWSKFQRELQSAHGKVLFASADTAEGWRGFADGAIEQASVATREALRLLRTSTN